MMIPALVLAAAVTVAPKDTPTVKTHLRSIALFKNGYAFYVREASCPAARSVSLTPLSPAALGTFWIASDPKRLHVVDAVGRLETVVDSVPAGGMDDLLRANVGRSVILDGEPQPTKILRLLDPPASPTPDPYRRDGGLMIIETARGERAVPRNTVTRLESVDGPLRDRIERTHEAWTLRVTLDPHGAGPSPLVVSYLAGGAAWVPSYAVDISDPKQARLTAKAEVFSEDEDLEDTDVQFVTGFPNLGFRGITSPIAMQGDLAQFLTALYGTSERAASSLPLNGRNFAQLELLSVEAGPSSARLSQLAKLDAGAPAAGETREDLFFYDRKGVTLRRGERAYYPLFTVSVPYEHVYEWPASERAAVVWHSVRLSNETAVPWTGAPAVTMSDNHLLGQDALPFTAAGARGTLRITQALDLSAESGEIEKARDRDVKTVEGYRHDRVTLQGELRVSNHKKERVTVEITKLLSGEMVEAPASAEVVTVGEGLNATNPTQRLLVKLEVAPGATATARYVYKTYLRS